MHRIITFGSGAHFQAFSPTLFLIQKEVKCHTWIGLTSDSDCFEDKKERGSPFQQLQFIHSLNAKLFVGFDFVH